MTGKFYYLVAALSALCLVSCGKNDDGGKKDPELPAKVTANVTYNVGGGRDMLNLFDISVKFTDKDGKTATENVTNLQWDKQITAVDVPFTSAMELVLTPKQEYPDKSTYEVGVSLGISYVTTDNKSKYWSSSSTISIDKSKVAAYQETLPTREYKASEEIK